MSKVIDIDPVTRLEGHYAVRVEYEDGKVTKAYSAGEMFRGFEVLLRGRDPMDAQQITQRICGVCPISHGTASILAQDQAYGLTVPENGRLVRNLILGANYIQSHLVHFYHLAALDFVDVTAVLDYTGQDRTLLDLKGWVKTQLDSKMILPAAPFLPRYSGGYIENKEINLRALRNYLEALNMRAEAHKMLALFAAKAPHSTALIPGGATEKVTADKIAAYGARLAAVTRFIEDAYLPDVLGVAEAFPGYFDIGKSCGKFLAYGVFSEPGGTFLPGGVLTNGQLNDFDPAKIAEQNGHSKFSSTSGLHPARGETKPDPHKKGAYSWLKAPRYDGKPCEVGPLARMLIAHAQGHALVKPAVDGLLKRIDRQPADLDSVLGRHAARAVECLLVARQCAVWLDQLKPGEPTATRFKIPRSGSGAGLTEAPRGALGHWLTVADYKVANYQCVVPTTWNCSPRDDKNQPGPVEQSLEGLRIADPKNPLEVGRVIRSFDPCLACAVH